jgi:hypothetical protein
LLPWLDRSEARSRRSDLQYIPTFEAPSETTPYVAELGARLRATARRFWECARIAAHGRRAATRTLCQRTLASQWGLSCGQAWAAPPTRRVALCPAARRPLDRACTFLSKKPTRIFHRKYRIWARQAAASRSKLLNANRASCTLVTAASTSDLLKASKPQNRAIARLRNFPERP